MAARDDERRVATPRQRTRDDPVEVGVRKRLGDGFGLLPSALGQRAVGPARETARRVRLALAVTDEVEGDGLGHLGPTGHTRDEAMLHLAVPWMVEQVDADARLGQSPRDQVIVLAERVES